ncbi:SRPBCC domain-containing protein [Microbacterium sp. 1.5R]|uniref:SRPBCC domain-containing protein n=1 Tax=Microbacterium sp. 1.5R TaxID=1916917 RepID=UPI0011A330AD|nr:SRPBCC domain-containing protein [Microbacterium sp. 1.5R]
MTEIDGDASVIEPERFTVRRAIRIDAPRGSVWRAVTEAEHVARWFGRPALEGAGVGATGVIDFGSDDIVPLRIEALDEPRSITYRWNSDDALGSHPAEIDERTSTVFTFTLDEVEGGTLLTVVESGFERTSDPAANMESHRWGWDEKTDVLVTLLESAQ